MALRVAEYGATRIEALVYSSPWSDADLDVYLESGLRTVAANYTWGFADKDLDFLCHLPDVEHLMVLSSSLVDLSGLYSQAGLKKLEFDTYDKLPIDFSHFRGLERVFLQWRDGAESLFEVISLKRLSLYGFPPVRDVEVLSGLVSLERLELSNKRTIRSLRGIESLTGLRELGLYLLSGLESLEGVEALSALEFLNVSGCRKITDIGPVGECRELVFLALTNCGELDSLSPIRSLNKLQLMEFAGDTAIVDRDLSPVIDSDSIRLVAYADKKDYSHSKDFVEALTADGDWPLWELK